MEDKNTIPENSTFEIVNNGKYFSNDKNSPKNKLHLPPKINIDYKKSNSSSETGENDEIEKLISENQALRLYVARSKDELKRYQVNFPHLIEKVVEGYAEHVDEELASWIGKIDVLDPLLVSYEHRIDLMKKDRSVNDKELQTLRTLIVESQSQIDELARDLTHYRGLYEASLTHDDQQLLIQEIRLQNERSMAMEKDQEHITNELWLVVQERDDLFKENQLLVSSVNSLQLQLRTNSDTISQLKASAQRLSGELQNALKEVTIADEFRVKLASKERELLESDASRNMFEQELLKTQNEIMKLKETCDEAVNVKNTISRDFDRMVKYLKDLEGKLEISHEKETQIKEQNKKIVQNREMLEKELEKLKFQLNSEQISLRDMRRSHVETLEELKLDREKRERMIRDNLQTYTIDLERKVQKLHLDLAQSRSEYDLSVRNNEVLSQEVDKVKKEMNDERESLLHGLSQTKSEIISLKNQLSEGEEREIRRVGVLNREISVLTRELDEYKTELTKIHKENENAVLDWKQSQVELNSVKDELKRYTRQQTSLQTIMEGKIEALHSQIDHMNESHQNEVSSLRKRVAEADALTEQLILEARQLVVSQDEENEEIQGNLNKSLISIQQELVETVDDLNQMRSLLMSERKQRRAYQHSSNEYKLKVDEHIKLKSQLEDAVVVLTQHYESERGKNLVLSKQEQEMNLRCNQLTKLNSSLENQLERLKQRLNYDV